MALYIEVISTCVLCYRNDELVWSGAVFTIEKDIPSLTMQVTCLGWLEFLNNWLLLTANLGPANTYLTAPLVNGNVIYGLQIPAYAGAAEVDTGTLVTVTDPTGEYTQTMTMQGGLLPGGTGIPVHLGGIPVANYSYPIGSFVQISSTNNLGAQGAVNGGWGTIGTMEATTLAYEGTGPTYIDQCALIRDMLGLYAQNLSQVGAPEWMQALAVGETPSVIGSAASNPGNRNITWQEYQNLGQAIQQMSTIEYGFDFHIDPVTRNFNMFFDPIWPPGALNQNDPRVIAGTAQGASVNGRGKVRTNAIFGYHTGPQNVSKLTETTDGTQLCNQAFAVSQYGTGAYNDAGSISKYGLFVQQSSLTDSATTQDDVLDAYAAVQVLTLSQPLRIWTFDQQAYVAGGSALQPFGVDFDIGDYCYLISNYGIIIPGEGAGIDGYMPIRIFGYTVSIDEEGNETVTNIECTFQQQA